MEEQLNRHVMNIGVRQINAIVKQRMLHMAFDGLFTRAMTKELSDLLTDGRISKIHQPYKNEIVMIVRARGKNHKLSPLSPS